MSIGDDESRVMQVLEGGGGLTLHQVVRRSGVRRPQVVVILARLIRFGLASCRLDGQRFLFFNT